ncbi:MAG TPA: hypothetical protein VFB58_03890 [Chloroflexota bacterium]|nr:hypothetical protein [Chloroflexota bacterium]
MRKNVMTGVIVGLLALSGVVARSPLTHASTLPPTYLPAYSCTLMVHGQKVTLWTTSSAVEAYLVAHGAACTMS